MSGTIPLPKGITLELPDYVTRKPGTSLYLDARTGRLWDSLSILLADKIPRQEEASKLPQGWELRSIPYDYSETGMRGCGYCFNKALGKAVFTLEQVEAIEQARPKLELEEEKKLLSTDAGSWEKRLDEESGNYYYYNNKTKKSQWKVPPDYVESKSTADRVKNITQENLQLAIDRGEKLEELEEKSSKLKSNAVKTRSLRQLLERLSINTRRLLILLLALLSGGVAALVTNFLFPTALTAFAGLLALTGAALPLILVGIIGALYGALLLAFLERAIMQRDILNQRFIMNLVLFCVPVAGIGLGIFIVASTPSVLALLTVSGVTGPAAAALPFIFAGAITLTLTAGFSYLLYRVTGMRERQAILDKGLLSALLEEAKQEHKDKEIKKIKVEINPNDPVIKLRKAQRLALYPPLKDALPPKDSTSDESISVSSPKQEPDYQAAINSYVLLEEFYKDNDKGNDELKWQEGLVIYLRNNPFIKRGKEAKDSSDTEASHDKLLDELFQGVLAGYGEETLTFGLRLALENDIRPMEEKVKIEGEEEKSTVTKETEISKQYGRLFSCIQKGEKLEALRIIKALNPNITRPIPESHSNSFSFKGFLSGFKKGDGEKPKDSKPDNDLNKDPSDTITASKTSGEV